MTDDDDGLRARLTRQSEDTIGRLAQDLLENPLVSNAISRAFGAREKAAQAQEVALGALNLPSAADLERLTRRIRSVSQRLEGVEDILDRVEERISTLGSSSAIEQRLLAIEAGLDRIVRAPEPVKAPRGGSAGRSPATDRRLDAIERQIAGLGAEVGELRRALPERAEPLPRGQERIRVEDASG